MTAGAILRNARLAAGVTQQQLAASSGHHQPAISRIEREGGASFARNGVYVAASDLPSV